MFSENATRNVIVTKLKWQKASEKSSEFVQ